MNSTDDGTWVATQYYSVFVGRMVSKTLLAPFLRVPQPPTPSSSCDKPLEGKDANAPVRSSQYPDGARVSSKDECCSLCERDSTCFSWVHATGSFPGSNCWPLASSGTLKTASNREFGCSSRGCNIPQMPKVVVSSPSGEVLYQADANSQDLNYLNWPAPLKEKAYGIMDYPRFFVPSWGPTPIPSNETVDPALKETNG